jgi:hypothetical protein
MHKSPRRNKTKVMQMEIRQKAAANVTGLITSSRPQLSVSELVGRKQFSLTFLVNEYFEYRTIRYILLDAIIFTLNVFVICFSEFNCDIFSKF